MAGEFRAGDWEHTGVSGNEAARCFERKDANGKWNEYTVARHHEWHSGTYQSRKLAAWIKGGRAYVRPDPNSKGLLVRHHVPLEQLKAAIDAKLKEFGYLGNPNPTPEEEKKMDLSNEQIDQIARVFVEGVMEYQEASNEDALQKLDKLFKDVVSDASKTSGRSLEDTQNLLRDINATLQKAVEEKTERARADLAQRLANLDSRISKEVIESLKNINVQIVEKLVDDSDLTDELQNMIYQTVRAALQAEKAQDEKETVATEEPVGETVEDKPAKATESSLAEDLMSSAMLGGQMALAYQANEAAVGAMRKLARSAWPQFFETTAHGKAISRTAAPVAILYFMQYFPDKVPKKDIVEKGCHLAVTATSYDAARIVIGNLAKVNLWEDLAGLASAAESLDDALEDSFNLDVEPNAVTDAMADIAKERGVARGRVIDKLRA